ncbi:MAG: TRAP transporter small permease [Granulosicoccus sp.]|nr:TRAP transporter small permease [Granulosicoccus sp.]
MSIVFRSVRRLLDGLYAMSAIAAALCLIIILLLIVAQMVARWTGAIFPGAANYAGYAMAAASFLAFASALNHSAHIRVSILLNAVSPKIRRWLELWCFGLATIIAWYFVYHACKFTYWSWKFKEISQAQDASPLWIPQSVMVIGGVLLALALTDNLIAVITKGQHRMKPSQLEGSVEEGHV